MSFKLHVMQDTIGNKWVVDGLMSVDGEMSEDAAWSLGIFKMLTGMTETEERVDSETEMVFFLAQIGPFQAGLIGGPTFDEKIAEEAN